MIKPIYVFGIDRVVQNTVGAETYGNYFFLFNLVLIFQILLDMGIESFSRREIARYQNMAGKYVSGLIPIKFVLGGVYFLLCSIVGLAWGLTPHQWLILLVLMANQFMASFILYIRSNLGGLHLFKQESIISVLDRTIMIIVCGVLLYAARFKSNFRLEWFLLSLTLSYLITLFVSLIALHRKVGIKGLRFNLALYIPIIRQLLPYALLVLLQSVYYRIDTLFLEKLLPDGHQQVGIYAHAWRIIEFLANYALLFSMVLLPLFSRMIKLNERPISLLTLGVTVLLVPTSGLLLGCIAYRVSLFELLYHEHIGLSAMVFIVLCVSFLGMCISYTLGALLTANRNLKQLSIMSALAVVSSIVLNLILVPRYKVMGAAIANASTALFTIVFHILLVRKVFEVRVHIGRTGVVLLSALMAVGISVVVPKFIASIWMGLPLIIACTIVLSFVFRLLSLRELIDFSRTSLSTKKD